ncbi:MAG: helix-turn-helix transcriptional regulator [Proteobacteria bacterium]|nr:helix-turn-helix transcriptional regulator [Pseudomonadota bacterium]
MSDIVANALKESGIGICIKDSSGRVLVQNEICIETCGKQVGCVCSKGCMQRYSDDKSAQWQKWGTRLYRNLRRRGDFFDIALICTEHRLITLLQPLKEKQKKAIEYYRAIGLSKRELEVISHVIEGQTNRDIREALSISNSTLRTHLRHIYLKVRDLGGVPQYLPAQRSAELTAH